jgi:type IV secretory pathway VirB4 component
METGIMYGVNEHNDSLVVFDRFKMENANMTIFAKSGAGKSYTVKLEIIRQLMFGVEVIVLDPEHEYEDLCQKEEGQYINFSFASPVKINPFDLSNLYEEGENELGQKILSLHGLLRLMMGDLTAEQDALLDRAIVAAYKAKGITPDPGTQTNEPPLMEDLYKALIGMEIAPALDLVARLEKFITGSFRGLFDQKSNMDLENQLTVFSVKEIEEELRPIAMYVILDFIWTRVKRRFKKRLLIVDEAWYFMKNKDSASFLYSMAKRARKYYLGVTTISQDVEDFLANDYGKAIVSNSSIQFLMKQSSVSLPILANTFNLSQGEQQLLMAADVGEGVFFAGQNHVALRVIASNEEHEVITTNPEEVMRRRAAQQAEADAQMDAELDQDFDVGAQNSTVQQLIARIQARNSGNATTPVPENNVVPENTPEATPNPQNDNPDNYNIDNPPRFAGQTDITDYIPPTR